MGWVGRRLNDEEFCPQALNRLQGRVGRAAEQFEQGVDRIDDLSPLGQRSKDRRERPEKVFVEEPVVPAAADD